MKVVHIIARFNVGGTATWISTLSQSLRTSGIDSIVLSGHVQEGEIEDSRFSKIGGIHVRGLGRRISIFEDIRAFFELRSKLKQIEPDVVNTHTAKAGVLGRLAVNSLGKSKPALVHTIHGHLFRGYFSETSVKFVILAERLLSKFTDVMLFAGEKVMRDCLANGIRFQRHSFVVRPGIKIKEAQPSTHQSISIGWLASFAKVKQPKRVIELARNFPDVTFLIAGDGPLKNEVTKDAPLNCTFLGWTDSPHEFWPQCDIALLTSDNEALPISLIEAQMCGVPCITTPAGSASEVVIHGENGYVSEEFTAKSLEPHLRKLLENPELRRELGQNGLRRAKDLFSVERQLTDHINAYEKAIEIRRGCAK